MYSQACRVVLCADVVREPTNTPCLPTLGWRPSYTPVGCIASLLQFRSAAFPTTMRQQLLVEVQEDQVDSYGEASPCGATLPAACASNTVIMRTTHECDGWLQQYLLDGAEWLLPQYVGSSIR